MPSPEIPADVDVRELDAAARNELRSLPAGLADLVGRHLVTAQRTLTDEPEAAYLHALAARRQASRVGVVREACGLAAYHLGRWAEAASELRAARRLSGNDDLLPVIADCERGMGRAERALAIARSPEVARLQPMSRVEMLIVESGARRDLGQPDAAVVALQVAELDPARRRPWSARLFYAYADALLDAGREEEALAWFTHAARADSAGDTDAAERLAELEGYAFVDTAPDEHAAPREEGPEEGPEEGIEPPEYGAEHRTEHSAEHGADEENR